MLLIVRTPLRPDLRRRHRQDRRSQIGGLIRSASAPTARHYPSLGRSPRTGVVMGRGLKARAMFGRIADVATWIPVVDGSGFQPYCFPDHFPRAAP